MGSRDRRELRELAYRYFRIGRLISALPRERQLLLAAMFFADAAELPDCTGYGDDEIVQQFLKTASFPERLDILKNIQPEIKPESLFPLHDQISDVFQKEDYFLSLLQQPLVWIKIRPAKEMQVRKEFREQNIIPSVEEGLRLGFPAESRLNETDSFKKGFFRIQDRSSQMTAESFDPKAGESWWDCCAGAGGKGLALMEKEPDLHLYASDSRASILENLKERHRQAGTRNLSIFQAELDKPLKQKLPQFDGIIADVPCTGSGTWSRNPENLLYFDQAMLDMLPQKQLSILENAWSFLKKGKPLVYITCSIYSRENEAVINAFSERHKAEIAEQKYLEGYRSGAENMFLCRLIKEE
jgi:16S rRNA (cytosine967-C5)-methyltransferase